MCARIYHLRSSPSHELSHAKRRACSVSGETVGVWGWGTQWYCCLIFVFTHSIPREKGPYITLYSAER